LGVRSRSAQSLRFEKIVRSASAANGTPLLRAIDFAQLGELAAWTSVIDPDAEGFTLKFSRAGAGVCAMMGDEIVGFDYLNVVDPAIKGDAFDSAFVMLSRPCGVWQITPVVTAGGESLELEYTGFPAFDDERGRGVVITMVHHAFDPPPRIAQVRHATEWAWLELRGAGAGH
jgi:hypothetical protein